MAAGGIWKRQDGLTGFPEEILQEILIRLPAKSVLRCRAVCRSWRRLTSDPAFLVAHHRLQPTLHIISSFRPSDDQPFPDCLDAVDLQIGEIRRDIWPGNHSFDASCDGLLVIGSIIIGKSRICNPATRQWAPISRKVPVANVVGLFRHQPTGEYRVLFWRTSSVRHEYYCPNEYCVLTVGSDHDPRPILVFDTVAESFRHMRPPAVNPRIVLDLFDMNGMLAASCSKDSMMEMTIFLLTNNKGDIWQFQYRIKIPEMVIRPFQEKGDWLAKVVSAEGDLLVACFGWLLHCDRNRKGNLVAKFRYDDDLPVVTPRVLKESLIQHAFFQKD
ncbi:hypothetical protein EJB05_47370, partial [Eragrostis curvula]